MCGRRARFQAGAQAQALERELVSALNDAEAAERLLANIRGFIARALVFAGVWPLGCALFLGSAAKLGLSRLLYQFAAPIAAALLAPILAALLLRRLWALREAAAGRRLAAVRARREALLGRIKVELPMKGALELLLRYDPDGDHKALIDLPQSYKEDVRRMRADREELAALVDSLLDRLLSASPAAAAAAAPVPAAVASAPSSPAAASPASCPPPALRTPMGAGSAGRLLPRTASSGASDDALLHLRSLLAQPATASSGAGAAAGASGAGAAAAARAASPSLLSVLQKYEAELPKSTPGLRRLLARTAGGGTAPGGGSPADEERPEALDGWIVRHVVASSAGGGSPVGGEEEEEKEKEERGAGRRATPGRAGGGGAERAGGGSRSGSDGGADAADDEGCVEASRLRRRQVLQLPAAPLAPLASSPRSPR